MGALALGTLALRSALANLVAWIALANYVNAAASAHNLAVWVTELQSAN